MSVFVFGEGMVEISKCQNGMARIAYGGDTLNTAIHLSRLGQDVRFVSALGDDPFSHNLRQEWTQEGLDLNCCPTIEARSVGLYAIHLDNAGERSFTYWRSRSAARSFFKVDNLSSIIAEMENAPWLYLSGISLSIFTPPEREEIIALMNRSKSNGNNVVFDVNYRAKGWKSVNVARQVVSQCFSCSTYVLPSFDDLNELYGYQDPEDAAQSIFSYGVGCVVVKDSRNGAYYINHNGRDWVKPKSVVHPVDTTGAGDSFNAAFISALINEEPIKQAIQAGHTLAANVISKFGAVPSPDFRQ